MRWMWIDTIVSYAERQRLVAIKCISLAEEYLHDHFPADDDRPAQPVMPAPLMIEGMAQTAGILVGAANDFREKVILAKVVRAEFETEAGPGTVVQYDATLERIDQAGAATCGVIRLAEPPTYSWREIGRADLMFSHADKNLSGVELPEHNFVFGENLRWILRSGGLGRMEPSAK